MRSARTTVVTAVTIAAALVALAFPGSSGAAPAATRATTTTVAVGTAYSGLRAGLAARVSPTPPGGVVTITADGKALTGCSRIKISSGLARCSATFRLGKHTVNATYSGTTGYARSTGHSTKTVNRGIGKVVGSTGSCTTSKDALTAVDFAHWNGPVVRGCGTNLASGRTLLSSAHFTTANVQKFPEFICRLGYSAFEYGTRYPTSSHDKCVVTPPAHASWSFWTAAKGKNTWTYSPNGASADHPANGEVELWTFGGTDVSGTTGKPATSPNTVRAGLSAHVATSATDKTTAKPTVPTAQLHTQRPTHRKAQRKPAVSGATPDIAAATNYLVGQLSGGTHYAASGNPDYGLTLDSAIALAAAGGHDDVLGAMTDYLATHVHDYTLLGTADAQFADGGSVGKLALLAEMTGRDAHDFGGVDLIAALSDLTCTKQNTASQCSGKGAYRNTSTTFGQALGVLAQLRAGATSAAKTPIAYLESLQRRSGGFVSDTSGSLLETDSTAIAAMALAVAPGTTAYSAQTRALSWLAGQQKADGGFPGASGNSVNSAGLSVDALTLQARTYEADIADGKSFLASVQNPDGGFDVASGQGGSDVRATAQAVNGSVDVPFASIVDDLGSKQDAAGGADYLQSQLVNGDHYTGSFQDSNGNTVTFDDQGLTADGVFALQAAGGHAAAVNAMVTYLHGQVDAYADPTGAAGGPFSGSLAKLALVAESTGGDPHSFGGTDLLGIVKQKVCTAAIAGDFSPCTAKGDFFNAFSGISQSLGVLALQASPVAGDHLDFDSAPVVRLRQLQCADGGFSSTLLTGGAKCESEVDATGYAVQALATVPGADAVLGKAKHYLDNAQASSGLFSGAAGVNANSTALAAVALQTEVTSLYSVTGSATGPKTPAPVHAWQHSLAGLHTLVVPSGGYGLSANDTADLRASTQAVLAAAQGTLVSLSGGDIAAAPRDAATSAPTPPPAPPSSGSSGGSGSGGSGSGGSGSGSAAPNGGGASVVGAGTPADTGVPVGSYLGLALALFILGAGMLVAGRRGSRRRPQRAR